MKVASYVVDGRSSYGIVTDDHIVDIGQLATTWPTLRDAIAGDAWHDIQKDLQHKNSDLRLSQVELLPPIPEPPKILAVGKNYRGHSAAELGGDQTEYPNIFVRLTNTLVPHGGALLRPKHSTQFDYEGELAIVIGKGGRDIPRDRALQHVFGYSIFNDASVRDYQFKHSLTAGKNFFATGGFGPWIATRDEIQDPQQLSLKTRLNGVEVQNSTTAYMLWDISFIISYLSTLTPLSAGDVISTGTPGGVGFQREPNLWLKAGDVVEIEIAGIGTLRNVVKDDL